MPSNNSEHNENSSIDAARVAIQDVLHNTVKLDPIQNNFIYNNSSKLMGGNDNTDPATISIAKIIQSKWHTISDKEVEIAGHLSGYIQSVHYLFDVAQQHNLLIYARPHSHSITAESKVLLDFVTHSKAIVGNFVISFEFLHEILIKHKNLAKHFRFVLDENCLPNTTQSVMYEMITKIKTCFGFT